MTKEEMQQKIERLEEHIAKANAISEANCKELIRIDRKRICDQLRWWWVYGALLANINMVEDMIFQKEGEK